MRLIEVKSLGGVNYVRADLVAAVQMTANGQAAIVLEGGLTIASSETTRAIAARIEDALSKA